MNKELLSFIRTLSENDTKSLTQKALKTTEEVGELAKAILPYENAAGTLHRFVHRREILENAVDTLLCSLSIAYDLKYSDEEIEEMIVEKSTKWSGLQLKESKVKFPLPFEIHITVEAPNEVQYFKNWCDTMKVKPIILDLENNGKITMVDVMTSSVHFGNNNSAITEANRLAKALREACFIVLRIKIETVPWHSAAPSVYDMNHEMPENSYFESHLRIVTTEKRKQELEKIAKQFNAHLSRNYFKKLNNDEYIIMMTLREYEDAYEPFQMVVNNLKEELECEDFIVDKMEIEFAVYDTNTKHDEKWIEYDFLVK